MEVIIKGRRKIDDSRSNYTQNEGFEIARIKAGIILKDGGCFLQISSKPLSQAFQELFKNMKRDKHGFYK